MSVPGVWNITTWDASLWTSETTPNIPPVSNYTDLQSEVADIIKSTAVKATDIQNFINRAHDKIIRDLLSDKYGRGVPAPMMARGESVTDAQSGVTVPDNFIKARDVRVGGLPSRYVSPEQVETGSPGLGESPVVMDYYYRPPQLSEANPTNWLLEIAGDTYVYGACLQYAPWSKEFDMLPLWTPFYEDAIKGVKIAFGPQPRGNLTRRKSNHYASYYTIVGSTILFGSTFRRSSAAALAV